MTSGPFPLYDEINTPWLIRIIQRFSHLVNNVNKKYDSFEFVKGKKQMRKLYIPSD